VRRVVAAALLRVPTVLHEQNGVIGRANRFLARRVSLIATGFPDVKGIPPGAAAPRIHTGNPVRPAVLEAAGTPFPTPEPGGPLRLLVFGGSQGARVMSDVVPPALERLSPEQRARLRLVQQVRPEDLARVRDTYGRLGVGPTSSPSSPTCPVAWRRRISSCPAPAPRPSRSFPSSAARRSWCPARRPRPGPGGERRDARRHRRRRRDPTGGVHPERLAAELARRLDDPAGLTRAAAAAKSAGRADAAERLADAVLDPRASLNASKGPAAMQLPQKLGPVHFIGIGGIGMSGIAEVMHNLGYTVQGSDAADGYNVRRLAEKGVKTFVGHRAENVNGAELVVVSTAIKRDNPELRDAREKRLPVVRRAEMLAELMRFKSCVAVAGTHGKTTTTSLVATLLDAGGLDPTVINGGIINAYGTNARMGEGDWMVVEADESDGTFLKLPADVAVVTNIDPEHLDHFGSFDAIKDAFRAFIDNIPFYGFA
jgi:hypothetical protein